ncbi:MAG TPA: hypothetical protein VGN54_07320, partial [Mycobacteriales bacterium]|nr:hypothetical protein [Mycobacteriales bacterium]
MLRPSGFDRAAAAFDGGAMKAFRLFVGASMVLSLVAFGAGPAQASDGQESSDATCTGTPTAPGVLSGTYSDDVVVKGICFVNGGAAVVNGDLTLSPGSALNATFALNDVAGKGLSSLTVKGDLHVGKGAILGMGCEPGFSPCHDDPAAANNGNGALTGMNEVDGDLTSHQALAVIVHASKIGGDVTHNGGGGGVNCAVPTSGPFAKMMSPVFSDYEDNTIGGDLTVTKLQSCYFGALRNQVAGDVVYRHNTLFDPDASEVLANVIQGDISCAHNSPAVQFGDSMSTS